VRQGGDHAVEQRIGVAARDLLEAQDIGTRVVTVPCFELFEAQPADYQAAVIGETDVRVAVEAGVRQGWDRFIGSDGAFIGMTSFGGSAPDKALYAHFGITAEAVAAAAKAKL
jgi:transketolase